MGWNALKLHFQGENYCIFFSFRGGYAPLTPLYGRLISSLQDFFSAPVPIPAENTGINSEQEKKQISSWRGRIVKPQQPFSHYIRMGMVLRCIYSREYHCVEWAGQDLLGRMTIPSWKFDKRRCAWEKPLAGDTIDLIVIYPYFIKSVSFINNWLGDISHLKMKDGRSSPQIFICTRGVQ